MSEIYKGARVESKVVGEVSDIGLVYLNLYRDGDRETVQVRIDSCKVIEPAYEVREVYLSADGLKYLRTGDPKLPWCEMSSFLGCSETFPCRPMRKLVPEK